MKSLDQIPTIDVKYDWIFVNSQSIHQIEKFPFDFLIYFGHGKPESLSFNFFDQITPESHPALFANKIVYTMACNAGNLKGNQIGEIKGLDALWKLEYLDLWHNKIKKVSGLDALTSLKSLILNRNEISKIEGLDSLRNLEIL